MNEIMKVLTIIATVFMPLTFLVGVYGMNFRHMPELEWPWGYFALWGIMVVIAGLMLIYFKRKKWL
jgi:magnesium transporter